MELADATRLTNLVLGTGLMWVAMLRLIRDWPRWTRRERVVRVHLTAYLFVIAYGTVEALASDTPPGSRVFLVTAVHTSFALALWRTRKDPPHTIRAEAYQLRS